LWSKGNLSTMIVRDSGRPAVVWVIVEKQGRISEHVVSGSCQVVNRFPSHLWQHKQPGCRAPNYYLHSFHSKHLVRCLLDVSDVLPVCDCDTSPYSGEQRGA